LRAYGMGLRYSERTVPNGYHVVVLRLNSKRSKMQSAIGSQ